MSNRPNIILMFVDQWRGDCLSVEGHPVVHTPYLDKLAFSGARLRRTYSATASCIAARAALFTGQSQTTHGRVGYKDGVPWEYDTTLAGEFTRHGYQTQAVGKMHVYPERSQLGFQNVILHDGFLHFGRKRHQGWEFKDDYIPWLRQQLGRDADYFEHGLNCNSTVTRPWDKDEYLHPTNWVIHQSLDFLRRRDPRKPFFLFASFHRPHPPYDPPQWAFDMYIQRDMPEVPVGDWWTIFKDQHNPLLSESQFGKIDPYLLKRARAGYYGHMSHIDHQINRFIEGLPEYGVDPDNTTIMFSSDHGELMGDHHMFRKVYPYEGSVHIPMIVKGARNSGIKSNAVFDQVVELRDVMPTLLDCAGLPIPASVEGQSFLPIMRGESVDWRDYIHGEHTRDHQNSLMYLTDGREKYVWMSESGHEQFFDLIEDPQELRDLARVSKHKKRVAMWRKRLIEELTGRPEGFTDGKRLIAGRPVQPVLSQ